MENNQLQIFSNEQFGEVRFVVVDGKEYAVGVDIARVLEYANPSKAILDHCKGVSKLGIPSKGGLQETKIISEGDIYRLIVKAADQSKNLDIKTKAEKFEKWIFDEVLPTLRKTGGYISNADLMVNTYFSTLDDGYKKLVKGLFIEIENKQKQITEQAPLVSFAETCLKSKDNILVRQLAKIACDEGINIGEKRLYQKMRDWGLIFKGSTEPYQSSVDNGYFVVVEKNVDTPYGVRLVRTTKVCPKGQVYVIERLKKEAKGEYLN